MGGELWVEGGDHGRDGGGGGGGGDREACWKKTKIKMLGKMRAGENSIKGSFCAKKCVKEKTEQIQNTVLQKHSTDKHTKNN